MALKFMYITNNSQVARVAQASGVDRIFVDLEVLNKEERQNGINSVKSKHSYEDIKKIKKELTTSELLVRINPIHAGSEKEIETVIECGADIIMLPYFKTIYEITQFLKFTKGKVKNILLLETKEAVNILDEILQLNGIDEIHIGLNDLHLSYKLKFMFELLTCGIVESIIEKIKKTDIKYGFGGIARLGFGQLPAELILAEHYRLGSNIVILSRSFCNSEENDIETVKKIFDEEIIKIRDYENYLSKQDSLFFADNYKKMENAVNKILKG